MKKPTKNTEIKELKDDNLIVDNNQQEIENKEEIKEEKEKIIKKLKINLKN